MQRRSLILVGLAVACLAGGAFAWWQWPVAVETTRAARGPAIEAVYATGIVEPSVMVPVAPRTGGRLVAIEADEGAAVKRGQVLARIEAADLDQTVEELRAREQLARTQFDRTSDLVERKFVSPAELDRTRAELKAAQAATRRAEAQRDYARLVAPEDGIVLRRDGEPGQFVAAGQAVLTLACCAPLRVAAEVDEEDIARVVVGQKVVMRTDALPGRLWDGQVAQITPKGDPLSRSYRVRIAFDAPQPVGEGPLRTGMTVDANLIVVRREQALLLDNRALAGDAVWVVEQDRARRRAVQRGVAGSERTEIVSGLTEGERVVLAPPPSLREGRRVRATPAPMSAASAP